MMQTFLLILTLIMPNGEQQIHVMDYNLSGMDCIDSLIAMDAAIFPIVRDDTIARFSCELDYGE